MSGVVEEQTGTEASLSDVWDTAARSASQAGATAPAESTDADGGRRRLHSVAGCSSTSSMACDDGSCGRRGQPRRWLLRHRQRRTCRQHHFTRRGRARRARPPGGPLAGSRLQPGRLTRLPAPLPTALRPSRRPQRPAVRGQDLYAVQIAAVPTDCEAEQLLGWLAKEGYSAYLEPTTTARGRLLRVRVGPLPSLEVALGVAARLGEAGYAEHWITGADATE